MEAHPFFEGIWLHSDEELAAALGTEVRERETIHEWPLSCVQRLLLADGTRLVYKSQLPPTVEPEFYARAASPLLPGYRVLGAVGDCTAMVVDWIDAPPLREVARTEDEYVEHGKKLVEQIGEIGGNPPVYLDVSSADAWSSLADITLANLRQLILDGRFGLVDPRQVARLTAWATSSAVIGTITEGPRIAHGDLMAEQVFVAEDGYRVVDWQRPVAAPPEVDLVALLAGQGIEPRRHVSTAAVGIFWFLRLHWAVEAQVHLFPSFRGPLFDRWSAEAVGYIL